MEPKSYIAMLLYLFSDSSLSTCPKKNGNWKMAEGFQLSPNFQGKFQRNFYFLLIFDLL